MSVDNPVNTLHLCLAHAAYEGFPEYEYETRDWESKNPKAIIKKTVPHTELFMTVYAMFPQAWSSTAMGFGGIGGQAITSAYTVVLESEVGYGYCVYFGGRFAYNILKPTQQFYHDIAERNMRKVVEAKERYERTN